MQEIVSTVEKINYKEGERGEYRTVKLIDDDTWYTLHDSKIQIEEGGLYLFKIEKQGRWSTIRDATISTINEDYGFGEKQPGGRVSSGKKKEDIVVSPSHTCDRSILVEVLQVADKLLKYLHEKVNE